MDFKTACQVLATETLPENENESTFLWRLRQGMPPIPGQVTSLLLALKVIRDRSREMTVIDKTLAQSLFLAAYESRSLFEAARTRGVVWPPLLDEDLDRIAIAAYQIFASESEAAQG